MEEAEKANEIAEAEAAWSYMLDVLDSAPRQLLRGLGTREVPSSKADAELKALEASKDGKRMLFLSGLPQRALTAVRLAGESVEATTRLLRMPPSEVMSGPVVRVGLLAAGLTLWILDPKLNEDERARRMVSVLREDLNNAMRMSTKSLQYAKSPEDKATVQADIDDIKSKMRMLEKSAAGLPHVPFPNDEVLGTSSDSGYEYQLYTQISHGSLASIESMRQMLRHDDPLLPGAALTNYILAIAHAYFRAVWAVGSYILAGEKLEQLRQVLTELYKKINSNADFYGYLEKADL